MKSEFLETIKIVDAKPMHLEYHQKRYEDVLNNFGVTKYEKLKRHIDPPKKGLFRCRLIYTPTSIEKVEYIPYNKKNIAKLKLVYDNDIEYSFKYTDRSSIDMLYEKRKDADDILIIKNGLITDTSIANIAFYDTVWKTPSKPLLKGTTRHRLLHTEEIFETDIKVEDLPNFSKVALLNAMIDFDIIAQNNIKDFFC